tara:strand:+ start:508 stop:699 length:192 start_codon:yes stop_codon:yes gene_type:complete
MNQVEEYLTNNPTLKLSVKSISKRTGLRTKQVTYLCYNSKFLRLVKPLEVGCLKYKMNTFTAI